MFTVLVKAFSFVMIILTGYLFKKTGFFQAKDFYLFSRLVIRFVLPCAIISNFNKMELDASMLIFCVIGIGANLILLAAAFVTNLNRSGRERAFAMINTTAYNIGSFTTPFVQAFLGPLAFVTTSLIDTGNAIIGTGVNYTAASIAQGDAGTASPKTVLKSLLTSPPFMTYVVMTAFSLLGIRLPQLIVDYTTTVGSANAFLAMLAIGIGFDLHLDAQKKATILRIIAVKYAVSFVFAALAWLSPFALESRQAMVVIFLGPMTSLCPAFTGKLGGDVELSSVINSLSIVISIVLMTAALTVLV